MGYKRKAVDNAPPIPPIDLGDSLTTDSLTTDSLTADSLTTTSLAATTATIGTLTASSSVTTNTINERTPGLGVSVEGYLYGNLGATFDDNVTCNYNLTTAGIIYVNDIRERTSAHGVDIDSVVLKDGGITTTGNISVGGSAVVSAWKFNPGNSIEFPGSTALIESDDVSANMILRAKTGYRVHLSPAANVNTIDELTAGVGVTIESVLLKDGYAQSKFNSIAYATGAVSLSSSAGAELPLITQLWNNSTSAYLSYNATTDRIVTERAGYYAFMVDWNSSGTGSNDVVEIMLQRHRSGLATVKNVMISTNSSEPIEGTATWILSCAADDQYGLRGYHDIGAPQNITADLVVWYLGEPV